MPRFYKVGHEYRDLTQRVPEDEFINWLDTDGHTIGTTGGIRPKRFINQGIQNSIDDIPSSLFLVTTRVSQQYDNPWDDILDYSTGQILYWGDAKHDTTRREKKHNEFRGNKILEKIYDLILSQNLSFVPPIFHFTKLNRGYVHFSGLCVLDSLETTWYEDKGRPIKNFRCRLSILDTDTVDVTWLHSRASINKISNLNINAPKIWTDYIRGRTRKLILWRKLVRTIRDQLPLPETDENKILDQVRSLTPEEFESFCTALFQELAAKSGVQHDIQGTRLVRDGGFDFFGKFTLPYPLHYEINFKGEAKRWKLNPVRPKDLSRLVARLQRGEYGIYITTSYYTKDAQEEVYGDGYPVRLFSGLDIVVFLRLLGLIVNKTEIKKDWLERIKEGTNITK